MEKVKIKNSTFKHMESIIANLKNLEKSRLAEIYASTLRSFQRFRKNKDIPLNKIDSDLILAYEVYLKAQNITPNSSSFYMRNLRAIYNRAVENGITLQRFPFKHVYTGVARTRKRAISIKIVKKIRNMDLSQFPSQDFARDMFLFSFYTRGMSFVDMAYLRKSDLVNGFLTYRRRKTRQRLTIKWEKCMSDIVNKYPIENTPYLLPIIKSSNKNERKQYLYTGHNINRNLKIIGLRLELAAPLTMYVARHTWASAARSKNIPLTIISEGMGHDSEKTTRIYLAELDNAAVDKANRIILKSL